MDPVMIAGALAALFALVAFLFWRRAAELEVQVRALQAKLDEAAQAPAPSAQAEARPAEPVEEAPASEEPTAAEEPEEAPEAKAEEAPAAEPEEEAEEPEDEEEPAAAAEPEPPKAEPAPKPPAPDRLRLEALKVVAEAFELARYLDFDAIVEKPSTYRVTVPVTAANGEALRHLEDGMFSCLKQARIEDGNAILHIDTAQGPP